jgi:hypothetical protein
MNFHLLPYFSLLLEPSAEDETECCVPKYTFCSFLIGGPYPGTEIHARLLDLLQILLLGEFQKLRFHLE